MRIMHNVHHLLWCVCFPPSRVCNMSGEAQALIAEQIPRHQGGEAQQHTLLKHCSLLFCVRGSLSQQVAMEGSAPLEKQDCKGALRYRGAQHSKRGFPLPWSFPEVLLFIPPTLIATSRCSDKGTEGEGSDISSLSSL